MANLLHEVYQLYKEGYRTSTKNPDFSLETCWITEPVANQPFKASIGIYLIVRYIYSDYDQPEVLMNTLVGLIKATLDSGKYQYAEVEFAQFSDLYAAVIKEECHAVVKEERVEYLQNNLMPFCYAYDTLPTDYPDLSRITNILINHPRCAISFQLIPTHYTPEELGELTAQAQNTNTLNRGVSDRQLGHVSVANANRLSELYRYYSDNKSRAMYMFNILICGDRASTRAITTRVVGQISSSQESAPNLRTLQLPPDVTTGKAESLYPLPWVASDILLNYQRNSNIWTTGNISSHLYRFPYVITAEEAASFFRLPIGDSKTNAGFAVNETSITSKTYSDNLINAGEINIGRLKSSSSNSIGFSLKDLAKHMLIVGTPGSGKTTFSVGLLDRLWKDHHIPFLVIEPAKNEYRALIQSIPDIQVFTPGKNHISPFVFNPFVPPKNVRLETYKSTLKTAFAAGVSMSTPLDKIFEDTINNCYSDFCWLDSYTSDNQGAIFNITDFIHCFQQTFDEIGYTGDARNIGRAGIVRLKSLTNLFDNYFSIPIEDILSRPTVIELAAIENADQKALIIALLLLSILAYVNANYVGEGGLRNFILLEEAHVLLDASTNSGEGAANPSAIAQGLLKRMLAEIRSYGVGLAIADQSPRKVGIDIVALTDIKVAFRLVEGRDKSILADATGMTDAQLSRLAKLKPGEAFLYFAKLDEPEEIVTPDYRLENNISISLSDESIHQRSTYWQDRQQFLRPYPECQLVPYCHQTCDYDRRTLAKEIARRLFRKHIGSGCADNERLKTLLRDITNHTKAELNGEPFSRELLSCMKVYLWRHIRYESKLNISAKTIHNSLIKE